MVCGQVKEPCFGHILGDVKHCVPVVANIWFMKENVITKEW